MARTILILGDTGSGKSRSLLNLPPGKTFVINPDRKELPFKGGIKNYPAVIPTADSPNPKWSAGNNIYVNNFPMILNKLMKKPAAFKKFKYVVLDTISNAMVNSVMVRGKEKGYDKFIDFANEVYMLIDLAPALPCEYLIIMSHIDREEMHEMFKIPAGKLCKEKITPESLFTIVLYSKATKIGEEVSYYFETKTDGFNTCKSPEGMFPAIRIPNDMDFVIKCIEAYTNEKEMPALPDNFTEPEVADKF